MSSFRLARPQLRLTVCGSTTDLVGSTPVTVLLTSVIPNTNSLQELREAIKKTFGQVPEKLYGCDAILAELAKEIEQ